MTDYSPPVQSPLVLKLLNGETTFTVEISPPIAGSKKSLLDQAESLKPYIDAINVTDNAGASVAMSNMAASALLIANGHEVILQLNCRFWSSFKRSHTGIDGVGTVISGWVETTAYRIGLSA